MPLALIERLIDIMASCETATMLRFVARLVMAVANVLHGLPEVRPLVDRALPILAETYRYIPTEIYRFADIINFTDPRWNTLFESRTSIFSAAPLSASDIDHRAVAKMILQAYEADRSKIGLLLPLASLALARDNTRPLVPPEVTIPTEASPVIKTAAIVCRILSGFSVDEMVSHITELPTGAIPLISQIATAITKRGLNYNDERDQLMMLATAIAPNENSIRVIFAAILHVALVALEISTNGNDCISLTRFIGCSICNMLEAIAERPGAAGMIGLDSLVTDENERWRRIVVSLSTARSAYAAGFLS